VKYAAVVVGSPEYCWLESHSRKGDEARDTVGTGHCWRLDEMEVEGSGGLADWITTADEFVTLTQAPTSVMGAVSWSAVDAKASNVKISVFVCPLHACNIFVQPKMDTIEELTRLPVEGEANDADDESHFSFCKHQNAMYQSLVPPYHRRMQSARWKVWKRNH